jgi:hypothetical protein
MEQHVTSQEFMRIVRTLLRLSANAAIEMQATQSVLMALDRDKPQVALSLVAARETARNHCNDVLDRLEEATPDSLDDMLRRFEGPIQ